MGPEYQHSAQGRHTTINFAESLELRYAGFRDWLFYAQAELEEEYGHVNEFQTLDESRTPLDKDTQLIGQKYTVGANWYPLPRLDVSAQYYHKDRQL